MKAALDLRRRGFEVTLLEKSRHLGGKVRKWHCLFPTFTSAAEVLGGLKAEVADSDIEVRLEAEVVSECDPRHGREVSVWSGGACHRLYALRCAH